MIGAIIGDIAGSKYEFAPHKSKDFDFMGPGTSFTDDSVLTIAVGRALTTCANDRSDLAEKLVDCMKEDGRSYPECGFGLSFIKWLLSDDRGPYGSYGNGSAMRVSAAGEMAQTLEEAEALAEATAAGTHDHPEGIKGAQAVAAAIFLARAGASKREIHDYISVKYYALDFTLSEIRPTYAFSAICQESVPQAIECFLESSSLEDAVRNAVSIGGDCDTTGAMAGSIAEQYFGVPAPLRRKALSMLDDRLRGEFLDAESAILRVQADQA